MATKVSKEQYLQDLPIADKLDKSIQLTREDVLSPEGLLLIQCLTRDGMYKKDIAEMFGIKVQTFWLWEQKYPELAEALRKGKALVDYQVENALLKAALGYKQVKVKTITEMKPGGRAVSRIEKEETEVGPNTTACLAWLNNRKPEQWRRNRDNFAEYEDKQSGITINIIKGTPEPEESSWEDDDE